MSMLPRGALQELPEEDDDTHHDEGDGDDGFEGGGVVVAEGIMDASLPRNCGARVHFASYAAYSRPLHHHLGLAGSTRRHSLHRRIQLPHLLHNRLTRRCRLFNQRRILLGALIHLRHGPAHLIDAIRLFQPTRR